MDNHGRLISRPSGKCLDVKGYRYRLEYLTLQLFTCEDPDWDHTDHVWYFWYHSGTRYFRIWNKYTRKCVDILGWADSGNGANAQQYSCTESYYMRGTDHWWEKVYTNY